MKSVTWSREAQIDIAGIDDYYHDINVDYAARVALLAVKAGDFLADNPEVGQAVGHGVRKWRVARTPYLLFYRIDQRSIRITRVVHAARDWKRIIV